MRLGPKWYQVGNKTCYIPKRKRKSMLTGFKVSSLACKYVFYRPEFNAKRGPNEIEFLKVLKCKNEIFQQKKLKE